jgi:ABC-type lipoprotein release transport system permease subunit
MSIWTMMIREIAYRKVNFLLGLAGVAAAVGLLIGVLTCLELHDARSEEIVASKEEETKAVMAGLRSDVKGAMHGLGYNAIILPKDQALGDWYAEDYAAKTMPESWAARLANTRELVDRYLPRMRQKLKWDEKQWTIIVVGVGEERILDTSVCEDKPLVDAIPRGGCVVGYELHTALSLEAGEEIAVLGKVFRVEKCEKELGTKDDITIWMSLADAQELLDKPDLINEIMLVEHLSVWGHTADVRRRVAEVLPDCQVVEIASETLARAHARIKVAEEAKATVQRETEKRALLREERRNVLLRLVPLGSLVCAIWIGFLMYLNVRDRAPEIGVLMTLGFRPGGVRTLVLSKAFLLGAFGGLVGFALGTGGAFLLEIHGHAFNAIEIAAALEYFGLAQAMGIVTCVLGSWVPARAAAAMDPAELLHEE